MHVFGNLVAHFGGNKQDEGDDDTRTDGEVVGQTKLEGVYEEVRVLIIFIPFL